MSIDEDRRDHDAGDGQHLLEKEDSDEILGLHSQLDQLTSAHYRTRKWFIGTTILLCITCLGLVITLHTAKKVQEEQQMVLTPVPSSKSSNDDA